MISLKSIRMTQIIGTPRNIPIKPKKCPKTVIESKTQNGEIPTTSPRIFGLRINHQIVVKQRQKLRPLKHGINLLSSRLQEQQETHR